MRVLSRTGVGHVAESSPASKVISKKGSRLTGLTADRAASSLGGGLRAFAKTLAGASIRPLGQELRNEGRCVVALKPHEGDIWFDRKTGKMHMGTAFD
jgi:hypothetical protein